MSEEVNEEVNREATKTRTGGAAEFSPDRPANQNGDSAEVPHIPTEIVGNTTDIVSRDWTGVGGESVDPDEPADDQDPVHGQSPSHSKSHSEN